MEAQTQPVTPQHHLFSDRIRGTFRQTKQQLLDLERRVVELEKRARESVEAVPERLRGAWDKATGSVRKSLDFATSDDLARLAARVDELAKRVDRLARERTTSAAKRVEKPHRK